VVRWLLVSARTLTSSLNIAALGVARDVPRRVVVAGIVFFVSRSLLPCTAGAAINAWGTNGPVGGAVTAIGIDPTAPSIVYAGTASASVFKSTDGGSTWAHVTLPFTGVIPAVLDLQINPKTPGVLYAGTSDGVFKSTDAGATWKTTRLSGLQAYAVAIDPETPTTVYAGTSAESVSKSTDGGATWRDLGVLVSGRSVVALALDPTRSTTLYAGTNRGDVFRSPNGGVSWGPTAAVPATQLRALVIAPTAPITLYAASEAGVFRSTNNGTAWSDANAGLLSPDVAALTIDPGNAATLYAWSANVFKTTDGGNSWRATRLSGPGSALAVDPATSAIIYAGGGSGVSKSRDGGATWNSVNSGLSDTVINAVAVDPESAVTVYAGGSDVFQSIDSAATWNPLQADLPSLVTAIVVDPLTSLKVYAGTALGVFKSTDGGSSWKAAGSRNVVSALAIDPVTSTIVYAGTADAGILRSTDGGTRWSSTNSELTRDTFVNAIVIDPADPLTLYIGTQKSFYGSAFKSIDRGSTWIILPLPQSDNSRVDVYALAVGRSRPSTVYAGTSGGLFKSTDGGIGWSAEMLGGRPVTALAIDPAMPDVVYVGTASDGVFESTDGGATWTTLNTGLTNRAINALVRAPQALTRLYAATAGAGVFVFQRLGPCAGDCDGNARVTVTDLVTLVNIALDNAEISTCLRGDANDDGRITVSDIISAVNNALDECPGGSGSSAD
jgi:photosystem II stability/assembly factor-like uncharacterized protein